MATSYRLLSEQIQRLYVRPLHQDDLKPTLDRREVKQLVVQAINQVLKAQSKEGFTVGMHDVPKCSIATYAGISVVSVDSRSSITLPAPPIHLPMDMGVWAITKIDDPYNPFIPVVGQDAQVMPGTPADFLEGQVGYFVSGMKVEFTKDIRNPPYNVAQVNVELLVQALDQISETEVLPLSADQEVLVIRMVLEMLGMGEVALQELNKVEEIRKQMKHDNE